MFSTHSASDVFFFAAFFDAHGVRSPAICVLTYSISLLSSSSSSSSWTVSFLLATPTEVVRFLLLEVYDVRVCVFVKTPTTNKSMLSNNTIILPKSSGSPKWLHWNDSPIFHIQSPKPYRMQWNNSGIVAHVHSICLLEKHVVVLDTKSSDKLAQCAGRWAQKKNIHSELARIKVIKCKWQCSIVSGTQRKFSRNVENVRIRFCGNLIN